MQSKYSIKLLMLLLLLTVKLFAIDGKTNVYIKSKDAIYTSQKVTVSVEILSSAFSITGANIVFPASAKYIVQAPKSASYLGTKEINGTDWSMVHYEYEVYALQAGKIEIPSVSVSFTASMGYGQPKKEFTLQSDALNFTVMSPKGVKPNQFVLVTDNYTLTSKLVPEKKQLIVGDAVELSVVQKAKGVPDILFTPIVYTSTTFLRVYEKEPELLSGQSGTYDVSRTDTFTFVASGEGNVTLPKQELMWWNSHTEKVHLETLPEISFEILPDPQIAIDAKKAQQEKIILYVILALLMFLIVYVLFASKIRRLIKERKRLFIQSEEGKFTVLLASIETKHYTSIYKDFYSWLTVLNPELVRGGIDSIEVINPTLAKSLKELDGMMVDKESTFNVVNFSDALQKFRRSVLERKPKTKEGLPKAINPR